MNRSIVFKISAPTLIHTLPVASLGLALVFFQMNPALDKLHQTAHTTVKKTFSAFIKSSNRLIWANENIAGMPVNVVVPFFINCRHCSCASSHKKHPRNNSKGNSLSFEMILSLPSWTCTQHTKLQGEKEHRHHLKQVEDLYLCTAQMQNQKEYSSAPHTWKKYKSVLQDLKANSTVPNASVITLFSEAAWPLCPI